MSDEKKHEELMGVLRTILKVQALYAVRDVPTKKDKIVFLGSRLIHSQKATAVASATPDRKLAASLS